MIEKIVSASAGMSTVVIGGDVVKVTFVNHPVNYIFIRHISGEILASRSPNVADGVDGTIKLSAGGYRFDVSAPIIYISGSGVCEVSASALSDFPFKAGVKGGGSDVDGKSSYVLTNAVDYPLLGLNLYGKSVQDGTPTPDNPVEIVSVGDSGSVGITACGKNLLNPTLATTTINGVTITNNGDGTYILNGTATSNLEAVWLEYDFYLPKGIYKLFGTNGANNNKALQIYRKTAETNYGSPNLYDYRNNGVGELESGRYNLRLFCAKGEVMSDEIVKPMLTTDLNATHDDFEPYIGTTANITSALPLCGIPVDSDGNYTDSTGQQWVCDEVVYNADGTGKVVKRIDVVTLDGSENWYATNTTMAYCAPNAKWATHDELLHNDYRVISKYHNKLRIDKNYINVHLDTAMENYQTWLQNNPNDIFFVRKVPLEIPLSAAEMSALRALQTYNGITNISNDGGADMDVSYCTNKTLSEYVMPITTDLQSQIDELKAAVLSLGGNV